MSQLLSLPSKCILDIAILNVHRQFKSIMSKTKSVLQPLSHVKISSISELCLSDNGVITYHMIYQCLCDLLRCTSTSSWVYFLRAPEFLLCPGHLIMCITCAPTSQTRKGINFQSRNIFNISPSFLLLLTVF